jgi:glycyl-tRNA synthetase alpha chain
MLFSGGNVSIAVMPGLVPGIHVLTLSQQEGVDGRDKPGHDGVNGDFFPPLLISAYR